MQKTKILIDKPIALGFSILEFSKITMYKHWYRLKNKNKDNVKLLYIGIDSLVALIMCRNIYIDMNNGIDFYDTSNLTKTLKKPIKPEIHYKIPGLLKDELANTEIVEGIFDGPKAYILTCS